MKLDKLTLALLYCGAPVAAADVHDIEFVSEHLVAMHRKLGGWTLSGTAYFDDLQFSGNDDHRPLEVGFADVPLSLPAEALFANLQGSALEFGLGMGVSHSIADGRLAGWRWTAWVLWQQLELDDYSSPYVVLDGPSTGAAGTID